MIKVRSQSSEEIVKCYLGKKEIINAKCKSILKCWLLSENGNGLPLKLYDKCEKCIIYNKLWY